MDSEMKRYGNELHIDYEDFSEIKYILLHHDHHGVQFVKQNEERESQFGEWLMTENDLYICSCCGKVAPYNTNADIMEYWPELNYCPSCGAYMGGTK